MEVVKKVVDNQVTSIELVIEKKRQVLNNDGADSGDGYRRTRVLGQTLFLCIRIPAGEWLLVPVGQDDDGSAAITEVAASSLPQQD